MLQKITINIMGKRRDQERMERFNLGVVLGNLTDGPLIAQEILEEIVESGWNSNQTRATAAVRIQSWWRGRREREEGRRERQRYLATKRSAVVIQSWWRGRRERQRYLATRRSAVVIQAFIRGCLARRRLAAIRTNQRGGFMYLLEERPNKLKLSVKKILEFKVPEPVGICLLADGSLAVACRNQDAVLRFSKTGNELIPLESRRGFQRPSDILQLRSGEVVVRDHNGLQLFDAEHRFQTTIGEEDCNRYYGLAEDNQGRIITINTNASVRDPGKGTKTKRGQTDIFYFTKGGHLAKIVELEDVVMEEMRPQSMCLYLGYSNNKLWIVDIGLHCVYSIFGEDGEEAAAACGNFGDEVGEFDTPAGIAVDQCGNAILADSGNNRLQLIDSNYNIIGALKVS